MNVLEQAKRTTADLHWEISYREFHLHMDTDENIWTKEEIEQHLKDLETLKAAYQIANEREQQTELGE